jgi:hypothetical protein
LYKGIWMLDGLVRRRFPLLLLMASVVGLGGSALVQSPPEERPFVDGVYEVSTLGHLRWIPETTACWGAAFELLADIDAPETETWSEASPGIYPGFSPIGDHPVCIMARCNESRSREAPMAPA